MKDLRSRLGFNNNADVMDARELLKAKRTNNIGDVREILPKKSNTKFTIPIKTINNDKFAKTNTDDVNFVVQKPNLTKWMAGTTQKMSGKMSTNTEGSMGIFSRSVEKRNYPFCPMNDINLRQSGDFISPSNSLGMRTFNNFRGYQILNSDSPIMNRNFIDTYSPFQNRIVPDYQTSHGNGNEFRDSIHSSGSKRIIGRSNSPEVMKRSQPDNLEKVKFVVLNEDKLLRPSLTTPRLTSNSFISPIQGYRIEVKNLHPQVNVDDVFELFTSLDGDLRSCNLVRPGYAEVVFRTLVDAQKSIEEFHGRELDGRPMNLKLVTPAKEPTKQNINADVLTRISQIQSGRKSNSNTLINKDAIFSSMYQKSEEALKSPYRPFKFSVTL